MKMERTFHCVARGDENRVKLDGRQKRRYPSGEMKKAGEPTPPAFPRMYLRLYWGTPAIFQLSSYH